MSDTTTTTPENTTAAAAGKGTSVKFDQGRGGLFGVKAGMTQVYNEDGGLVAVTVIDLRPNTITQVKTKASDGYNALQISVLEKKEKSTNKPELGHFKKSGAAAGFYYTKEFRLPANAKMDAFTAGAELTPDFVKEGDLVDLIAISKGKGFQGGVKRFHMAGSAASHGNSVTTRSLDRSVTELTLLSALRIKRCRARWVTCKSPFRTYALLRLMLKTAFSL